MVEAMCAYLNNEQIAAIVGISVITLEKKYRDQLRVGKAKCDAMAAQTVVQMMSAKPDANGHRPPGTLEAAKFWLRTRAGWSENAAAAARARDEFEGQFEGKKAQIVSAAREIATVPNDEWGEDLVRLPPARMQ
jgi:hypothetical protein